MLNKYPASLKYSELSEICVGFLSAIQPKIYSDQIHDLCKGLRPIHGSEIPWSEHKGGFQTPA